MTFSNIFLFFGKVKKLTIGVKPYFYAVLRDFKRVYHRGMKLAAEEGEFLIICNRTPSFFCILYQNCFHFLKIPSIIPMVQDNLRGNNHINLNNLSIRKEMHHVYLMNKV